MRKVILQEFISLDSLAAGPKDSVLGSGIPLFLGSVDAFGLKLVEAKTFDRGAVQLKYKPAPVKKTSKKRAPKR